MPKARAVPMRIGILSQWFPPESGGASIPGVLARGLAERAHEVTVLTGYPNYPTGVLYDGFAMKWREDSRENGYAIRRVALYPNHSRRAAPRLLNYASFAATAAAWGISALEGIDVLWVYNSPASVAIPMWLTRARHQVPVVLHNMDMWPDSVLHTGFAPSRGGTVSLRALNSWVDAMYRTSSVVAYITPTAGEELERRGVPRRKLRYAPTWVDESVFRPADGEPLRRTLGYRDTDIVVGYAGALGRAQCVVELATTVANLPDSTPIKCLILGSGTEEQKLKEIERTAPSRIQFLGQVPHKEMTAYAAVPDISFVGLSPGGQAAFAAPSKVGAIMLCGKPILAMASGDTADLVSRSGAGLLVPPGDVGQLREALGRIARAPRTQLRQIGAKGLQFGRQELSAQSGIERLEQILAEAAATPLRGSVPK